MFLRTSWMSTCIRTKISGKIRRYCMSVTVNILRKNNPESLLTSTELTEKDEIMATERCFILLLLVDVNFIRCTVYLNYLLQLVEFSGVHLAEKHIILKVVSKRQIK